MKVELTLANGAPLLVNADAVAACWPVGAADATQTRLLLQGLPLGQAVTLGDNYPTVKRRLLQADDRLDPLYPFKPYQPDPEFDHSQPTAAEAARAAAIEQAVGKFDFDADGRNDLADYDTEELQAEVWRRQAAELADGEGVGHA